MIKKIINRYLAWSTVDRVNIFKTILINFMAFPLRTAFKFPILVYGPCKISSLSGKINIDENCIRKGILKIGICDANRSFFSKSYLRITGTLNIHGQVVKRRGGSIFVGEDCTLDLHDEAYIGDNVTIIVQDKITIGKSVRIANDVLIMDSDFHYVLNVNNGIVKNNHAPVVINDYCWIGGNCVIKKGVILPKGTILTGPYSMVSKDYSSIPEYSIIGGCPAKLISSGFRRVNNSKSDSVIQNHYLTTDEPFVLDSDVESFCSPF